LNYVAATATVTTTVSVSPSAEGSSVTLALEDPLAWNNTATITLVAAADAAANTGPVANTAFAMGSGVDVDQKNNRSSVTISVFKEFLPSDFIYLPLVSHN
jgi:hypothetical protein